MPFGDRGYFPPVGLTPEPDAPKEMPRIFTDASLGVSVARKLAKIIDEANFDSDLVWNTMFVPLVNKGSLSGEGNIVLGVAITKAGKGLDYSSKEYNRISKIKKAYAKRIDSVLKQATGDGAWFAKDYHAGISGTYQGERWKSGIVHVIVVPGLQFNDKMAAKLRGVFGLSRSASEKSLTANRKVIGSKFMNIDKLTKLLMPMSGNADTAEGEMIRAYNKVGYRFFNDGDLPTVGYGAETSGPALAFLLWDNAVDRKVSMAAEKLRKASEAESESKFRSELKKLERVIENVVNDAIEKAGGVDNLKGRNVEMFKWRNKAENMWGEDDLYHIYNEEEEDWD